MNVRALVLILVVGLLAVGGLAGVYFTMFAGEPEPEVPAAPPPPPDRDGDGVPDHADNAADDPTRWPAWAGDAHYPSKAASHVMVLAASEEIPENTLLEDRHIREVERARGDYPDGTILADQKGKVVGEISKVVIREGEFYRPQHFFGGRRLAFLIPRFMRAISFNYSAGVDFVGGLLKPGDIVDIMGHFTVPERPGRAEYTKVFLQGVKILGIGPDLGFPPPPVKEGEPPPPPPPPATFITLALTPREAELLFWAEKSNPGNLRYALRSPLQRLDAATIGVTADAFFGVTLMRRPHEVEVVRGARAPETVRVPREKGL
jgi:Flp pilus assembly protein CpaB